MRNFLSKYLSLLIRPFAEVHSGEKMKVLLTFLYFFLTIASHYIIKAVRSGMFISQLGPEQIRYANVFEGIVLIVVVWIYTRFAKRLPRKVLYPGVLIFLITNLLVFWILLRERPPQVVFCFYIWQKAFSSLIVTQFWILANDIFNPLQAKRLFGLIISGGSLGGILGSKTGSLVVQSVKAENLLLVVVGIMALCVLLIRMVWKEVPDAESPAALPEGEPTNPENGGWKIKEGKIFNFFEEIFKFFTQHSYLLLIAGLVIISKMSSTIVENTFGGIVASYFQGKENITQFYLDFYTWLNIVAFIMQLVVTRHLLKHFGVKGSLWILPVGLLALSAASILWPILIVGILYRMFDGGVNYSVHQASKEILYLPLSNKVRLRAKPWIDMVGYRGSVTLAGLYMIPMASFLGISASQFGILVVTLIPFWLFLTWKIKKRLETCIETKL